MPSMRALLQALIVTAVIVDPAMAQRAELPTGVISPTRSCESLRSVDLRNTTIDSAVVVARSDLVPSFCRVVAIVTHPPAGDRVKIWVGLPLSNWNGRFNGTGGSGLSGGNPANLVPSVARGFVAAATDTGHEGGGNAWALGANGRLNWMLIRDAGYLGAHEMTVTAKALTEAFFGSRPRYSYWTGCSTGGRQGLSEAQRYPADYDGILAGAPALGAWRPRLADFYGQVLMLEANHAVAGCKFEAATAAAVAACDELDGLRDGVIGDPRRCTYDPEALVGTSSGDCGPVTHADADIIRKIWQGPRRPDGSFLGYGQPRGAAFIAATEGDPLRGRPSQVSLDRIRYFLTQDLQWDWTSATLASFEQLWDQTMEQYGAVHGTESPNLEAFRDRGGKVIIWHGWADQSVYPENTIAYFENVQREMGGPEATSNFVRLFMAPGVAHCRGGVGPELVDPLRALIDWVEEGIAPGTLPAARLDPAGTRIRSRPLCSYPLVARYQGSGSVDDAENFACVAPPD